MRAHALLAAGLPLAAADFSWDAIPPSKSLDFHPCYDDFQCARFILPLDWTNKSDTRTVTIAVTKLPATVSSTDPSFGGPVFTNPGGPGGSGVNLVLGRGKYLQWFLDKPNRHYEIVSFDPRGIGRSTPSADCYPGDLLVRYAPSLFHPLPALSLTRFSTETPAISNTAAPAVKTKAGFPG